MKKITYLAVAAFAAFLFSNVSSADVVVSINAHEFNGAANLIDGAETYGVASEGSVVGNWNNVGLSGSVNPVTNLLKDDGTASTVDYLVNTPNGGETIFNATYDDTPFRGFIDLYASGVQTVTVSDLNATFAGEYKIIYYLAGFTGMNGGSISDGTTTYYYETPDTVTATLIEGTNTTAGTYPEANYVVFEGLTADSVTLTLDVIETGGGSGFGGLQIVGAAVPEPTSLLMLGAIGLGVVFRRRKS